MRRNHPLLATLFIPLAVLLVGLVLSAISPWRQPGPLSRLQIGPDRAQAVAFDSRALSCPEQFVSGERSDQFQLQASCQIVIAGKELALRVEHQGIPGRCTATYDGKALTCESHIPFYNASLPAVFIQSDLGLDAATLKQLPGANPLFAVSEQRWFWLQVGLAAVITVAALLIASGPRLRLPMASFASVGRAAGYTLGTLLVFAGVWYALLFALLVSGLVD